MSIIASAAKSVKFHQWPEGTLQHIYLPKSREGNVQSISWGKDGSWLVVVPDSGPTEVITIKDNVKLLQTIQDVYRPSCATFHSTTKKLIGIGTVCGQTMIYDIKGKCIKKRFPRVSSKICSLHYNSKDTHLAAVCNNGEILLLSNLTGNISTIYKVPNSNSVTSANFHRVKRNLFAAGSNSGVVAAWDFNSNQMLCNIQAHQAPISSLMFSPLNNDLIVTGGLDRKFSFNDLRMHKHLMDVEVNNAVTSLDYSHCGVYLGIGFQNGNIAIYDARRTLNNPLTVFEAHRGNGVQQLHFQKVLSDSLRSSSVYDITLEETSPSVIDASGHLSNNASVFDSLGIVSCDESNTHLDEQPAKASQELDDSFLIALGLDESNQSRSIKNDTNLSPRPNEEYKEHIDSTKQTTFHQHGLLSKTLNKKLASTPKYLDAEPPNAIQSPILSGSTDNLQGLIKGIVHKEVVEIVRQEVRDIVREEVKAQIDSLQSSINYQLTDMLSHIRLQLYDVQMAIVREFIEVEDILEKRSLPQVQNSHFM